MMAVDTSLFIKYSKLTLFLRAQAIANADNGHPSSLATPPNSLIDYIVAGLFTKFQHYLYRRHHKEVDLAFP